MKSCTLKFKVMILHQKKGGVLTLGWGGISALNAGVCVARCDDPEGADVVVVLHAYSHHVTATCGRAKEDDRAPL